MRRTPARRVEPGSALWRGFLASGSSGHDFMRSLSSPRRKVQLPYVIQCIKTAGKLATTSVILPVLQTMAVVTDRSKIRRDVEHSPRWIPLEVMHLCRFFPAGTQSLGSPHGHLSSGSEHRMPEVIRVRAIAHWQVP